MNKHVKEQPSAEMPAPRTRPVATLAVFALIGPIIGYFVWVAAIPLVIPAGETTSGTHISLFLIVFTPFILFSHVLGGIPAIATGVVMVLADHFAPRAVPMVAIAILVGAISSFLWATLGISDADRSMSLVMAATGAISGAGCYALSRHWRYLRH